LFIHDILTFICGKVKLLSANKQQIRKKITKKLSLGNDIGSSFSYEKQLFQ